MFEALLPWATLFLLANLAAGLWRIWKGPSDADRLLTALLFGTTSVAMLLLLSAWQQAMGMRTVALILVLLATIVSIAFFGMPAHHDD
ncbi:MAG: monovalent cation/H+ antiporter complex subunit F [Wenzhouxiangellaceae bacterium]|nr:monovalent cation/H+ antiporter complex subunit F [Wenzhouxiangellaceae bacterium]